MNWFVGYRSNATTWVAYLTEGGVKEFPPYVIPPGGGRLKLEWGVASHGTRMLALLLLTYVVGDGRLADMYADEFCAQILVPIHQNYWTLSAEFVSRWIVRLCAHDIERIRQHLEAKE